MLTVNDLLDLSVDQFREIKLGLEQGLDVGVYTKPEFDDLQMEEIRIGLVMKLGRE